MLLTPEQASEKIGVPAAQLKRWACTNQGPRNAGNWLTPKYEEADLEEWLASKERLNGQAKAALAP